MDVRETTEALHFESDYGIVSCYPRIANIRCTVPIISYPYFKVLHIQDIRAAAPIQNRDGRRYAHARNLVSAPVLADCMRCGVCGMCGPAQPHGKCR